MCSTLTTWPYFILETHLRHLMRLWLRDPENDWPTPSLLQHRWDKLYKHLNPEKSVLPLEPFIRSAGNKSP
ncbi:hypothetical protein HYALB_00003673 [Hymenoscyphus albidus]|uniref:Uncharacterized protein n=1 Tax=Hymenoscyphus albidus TaxID=595503 RepID=A0A9N9LEI9_9HELO|nr:hypothetical protein HYALB_00003673 [Hymenoscyphus albidus]